ncbi:hypothetical protein J6590_021449 [Homalodisca vitripennis]|nr:hypothetical protein J6590_021449 [Homalodisca vitripennis]
MIIGRTELTIAMMTRHGVLALSIQFEAYLQRPTTTALVPENSNVVMSNYPQLINCSSEPSPRAQIQSRFRWVRVGRPLATPLIDQFTSASLFLAC